MTTSTSTSTPPTAATAPGSSASGPAAKGAGGRPLSAYPVRMAHLTRWSDNDMYGHLNNAKYYELFDTTINTWIADHTGADFVTRTVIGVVAESGCRFHTELSFPGHVTVGLRLERLGTSSVVYELAVFDGQDPAETRRAAATGRWVHVYIDRATKTTVPVPDELRAALVELPDLPHD